MEQLTPHEARLLGVLIEKAHTTPAQYPLTVNALVSGANQKSNRLPVMSLTEDDVLVGLDALRAKGLVREVMLSGSRVEKFRHVARERLEVTTSELVVLAELLLRGPQTSGELRGRASRMHALESLDVVTSVLDHLERRPEPLVRGLPPAPGSRAPRYAHRLGPVPAEAIPSPPAVEPAPGASAGSSLATRVARLESEVASLQAEVERLARAPG